MKRLLFICFVLLNFSRCLGQGFPVYSELCYGNKLIVNNDGSFVVAGSRGENPFGNYLPGYGGSIIKFDINGNMLWHADLRTVPLSQIYMYVSGAAKSLDSGYVICGDSTYITGLVTRPNYLYLVKYDENGNRIWKKDFCGNNGNNYGPNINIQSSQADSRYYCASNDRLYKLSATGDSVFSAPNPGIANNFVVCSNSGIAFLTGFLTARFRLTDSAMGIIAEDSCSVKRYQHPFDVFQTSDSCWLISGRTYYANNTARIIISKFSKSGNFIWSRFYECNDLVEGVDITEHNGLYYITGTSKTCLNTDTISHCYGVSDAVVFGTDTAGNKVSELIIRGDATNMDSVKSYSGFQSEFLGDTLYTLGTHQLIKETGIVMSENIIHSGLMVWKHTLSDFMTVAGVPSIVTNDIVVYPNPANDIINIQLPQPITGPISVYVTDMTGRVFYTGKPNTVYVLQIDTKGWPQGLYIVSALVDGRSLNQKVFVSR